MAIIYFYIYISYRLAADDFEDVSPAQRKILHDVARELGVHNPERIKLKLTQLNSNKIQRKTWKRWFLDVLFLVPFIQFNLEKSLGCTGPVGNIYISPTMLANKNRVRFLLGHELSHVKYKDVLVGFFSKLFLNIALKKSLVGILSVKAILGLSQILHSQVIGKLFEIRADLKAASLGKEVIDAGIQAFREFQSMQNKKFIKMNEVERRKALINQLFFDPHPYLCNRIKYLNWYKKWRYPEARSTNRRKLSKQIIS